LNCLCEIYLSDAMSALGQKQTFALHQLIFALPPKADICGALAHVCFGPIADIGLNRMFEKNQTSRFAEVLFWSGLEPKCFHNAIRYLYSLRFFAALFSWPDPCWHKANRLSLPQLLRRKIPACSTIYYRSSR